jgi:hypothetical protein
MYSFPEKNRITQELASADHFQADKDLFLKHCTNRRLEHEIARANPFTYHDTDARLLSELLDKVSEQDIVSNRKAYPKKATKPVSNRKTTGKKATTKKNKNPKNSPTSTGTKTDTPTSSSASSSTTSASPATTE